MNVKTATDLTNRCYDGRQGLHAVMIGVHTMEAPEAGDTAEAVARYFKTVDASAHWCVDNNSRVRVVADEDGAWTMPPRNQDSLNIEMAGFAGQTVKQWDDKYSNAVLDIAALCAAEWCWKYEIPVIHLDAHDILARHKGFAGHVDVNAVYHVSTHTDPGPHFPWPKFLKLVHNHLTVIHQSHAGS